MSISNEKEALREKARATRAALAAAAPDHARALAARAPELSLAKNSIVGAYVSLPREADPGLLADVLRTLGHTIVYPRVISKTAALAFHSKPPARDFVKGGFGVPEPEADWPRAEPTVLLVPLLAFDADGYRLGYGGGHYDRTLHALRARGAVTAIGIAYAGQEVETLPREAHDHPLDMILTEDGVRVFTRLRE